MHSKTFKTHFCHSFDSNHKKKNVLMPTIKNVYKKQKIDLCLLCESGLLQITVSISTWTEHKGYYSCFQNRTDNRMGLAHQRFREWLQMKRESLILLSICPQFESCYLLDPQTAAMLYDASSTSCQP